ncbi:hypothetical protein HMPREF0742_01943 [Rothia aeria F0184]|uniref:Uncharacterized protein n=1 Tax=Rothia aeria F0184 TaxID=888019 RepID=U7V476_9MICC|nr:hypothetical protein HMPREF0742_01943 [Rothia aeria F0184]
MNRYNKIPLSISSSKIRLSQGDLITHCYSDINLFNYSKFRR